MTLSEALAYAREHHPRLAAAEAQVAQREAEARVPRERWKPRLGATVQAVLGTNNNSATNWLGSGGAVEFPRIAGTGFLQRPSEIDWKPYMSTAVGLGVEQRVFDFGRTAAEAAAADARTDATSARLVETGLAIELGVRESYYALLAAKSVLVAAQDARQRALVHRDETAARVTQGLRPRVELERVEADLARFEVGIVQAQGGVQTAASGFARAVGLDAAQLDVAGDPAPIPALPPLAQALHEGEQRDPVARAVQAELHARKAETRALSAELLPELKLVGTVMGASGGAPAEGKNKAAYGAGFVPWIPDYFAGLVLSWRFYDAPARAKRDASRRAEAVLENDAREVRLEALAAIEQAWISVDVAQRSVPSLERAVEAAHANYAQAEGRYRAELANAVELADAEALRTDAEIKLALGRFDIARTRAQLARTIAEGQ